MAARRQAMSLAVMLCLVGCVVPCVAFVPSAAPRFLRGPAAGRLAVLPRARPQCRSARLRMKAADDDDAPADVFFSLKQRLQKANVWLVGMDGSDKAVIGKELAKKLGYKFMDTNEIIASLLKSPIETAMATLGEEEFRKVETAVLDQVQAYYGTVVSTGSIAPVYPENWSKFRTGLVAYCKVPPEGLKNEGLQDVLSAEAPLLAGMPDNSRMELLLAQREIKYSQADATITLTGSEDIEKKLVAVANGLRVFIIENPAPEKPMLGEAHARAISREVYGLPQEDKPNPAQQEQVDALNALLRQETDDKKSQ